MESKNFQISHYSSVNMSEKYGGTMQEINGVIMNLENSTSRARIFNIAMKLATIDWQDPIVNIVEKLIDDRLVDIAMGTSYVIQCKIKSTGRQWKTSIKTRNETEAKHLIQENYPESEVINVEEYQSIN